jgi:hypothetical protein
MYYYGLETDREKEPTKPIVVTDINLLYSLADNNLLEFLIGVRQDRKDKTKRVWLFDGNVHVQDIINSFYLSYGYKKQK